MIEQFFDEYNISENKLKDKIYKTYCELCRLRPEKWSSEVLTLVSPDHPSLQILGVLFNINSEEIENLLNSQRITILDLLRLASFTVDTILKDLHLENLLFEQFLRKSSNHIYKMIFVFICLIIVDKKQNEINFDIDLIYDKLDNTPENLIQTLETLEAMIFVKEQIDVFRSDEKNKLETEQLNTFIDSVDNYVQKYCLTTALLSTLNLFGEAYIKYTNDVHLDEQLTSKNKKEILDSIRKFNKKDSSKRLEIKQGGRRERKGFKWTNDCKIKFFETVENLPKIKNKSMWDYAFEKLNEESFNYKYIDYLSTETAFKDIPDSLFREAVRTWQIYKNSFNKPKSQEKPFAFALKHALFFLDYPKTKYLTMKKYYGEGKKLFINSNLNKENSK